MIDFLFSFVVGTSVFFGLGSTSFKIVNQGEEALVASFGKYKRKLPAGPHFIVPFIDTVSYRGSIKEQVLDIPPQQCITRDNVAITADAVVYWRVVDMEKAFYRVENLRQAMTNIVLTQIRAELGSLELDETFTARSKINEILLRDLDDATDPWGVKVTRVELRDILPAKAVQESMELQMTAERKKRAAILTSEGERESAINKARGLADSQLLNAEASQKAAILEAEGQKQSRILRAEAERQEQVLKAQGTAQAMQVLLQSMKGNPQAQEALQFLLAQSYISMGTAIGSSGSSKVMFMDPRAIPATLEGLKSMVDSPDQGDSPTKEWHK
ncbi:SPFH/Band 7/PHB domain protein [Pseudanabaena sp. FACHB-1998]|uniref:SPFH domain-containing protein n=1 Tax=Pseudanabaena sp. FACHB-1998 TaxID=2692858 RepID=UPI00168028C9|nr:SPFH domain-containing protein [Pseudanabaena sp. FACHB-1998]MBD2178213.1 SPFH/Band 7/PHB domain protein [Pseudanabaena sp. FACHB-1998]